MSKVDQYQHRSIPIEYKGNVWPSYTALATHYGLLPSVVRDRLQRGQPLEIRSLPRRYYDMRRVHGRH